jgi:hypothetical protein
MDEAAAAEGRAASLHLGYEARKHLTRRASFVNVVARAVNTSSRAGRAGRLLLPRQEDLLATTHHGDTLELGVLAEGGR